MLGESELFGEFKVDGGLNFGDEAGSLNRLQRHVGPSARNAPEDPRQTDPRRPLVVSIQFLSPPMLQSNRLVLSDVTLHGTAARIYRLLSIESRTQRRNGSPCALTLSPQPILG